MTSRFPRSLLLAVVAALGATVAQAGPAGSGLAHTEKVARGAAGPSFETIRVAPPSRDCVSAAAAALRRHEAVKGVRVEASDLSITVRTDGSTARGADLRALVARVCAAPNVAATS